MDHLGKGFMPGKDDGRFIFSIKTPLGSSIGYTRDRLAQVEQVLKVHPEIRGLFSTGDPAALGLGAGYDTNGPPRAERRCLRTVSQRLGQRGRNSCGQGRYVGAE